MTKKISVMYCFPRSGGTLLNQCLLCEPANVVLSEVNPTGCVMALEKQASQWFNLLTEAEVIRCADQSYLENIDLINHRAQQTDQRVCLRDWTGINFIGKISPWHGDPSMRLEQRTYLSLAGYKLNEIALLRRSKAVYQSILENIPELNDLSPAIFCSVYRTYLEQTSSIKKFHLETLVNDRKNVLQNICTDLDLRFPADFETRFHSIQTVTGNNTLPKIPASAQWTSIHGNEEKANAAPSLFPADANLFEELDELAGYERPAR